ncbi:MAG: hypothetical protein ABSE07_02330 [Methanoregula sp.]
MTEPLPNIIRTSLLRELPHKELQEQPQQQLPFDWKSESAICIKTDGRLLCERPFDEVLNIKSGDISASYQYDRIGSRTFDDRRSRDATAWKHIIMPASFQTFIIEALQRIHHKSVNQILQRGIIEGYYIFSSFIVPRAEVNYTALRERSFKGDMKLIEGLRSCRCDITVDDINPEKSRMIFTLDKEDAETIGSHADNIRIDRQVFNLVLFCYALRTYTSIAQIWVDRCNITITRFETKYFERVEDIKRRLDQSPEYGGI